MIFSRKARLEPRSLLAPVFSGVERLVVGWPDEPVELRVARPQELQTSLRELIERFQEYWSPASLIADVSVVAQHRRFDVRVARRAEPRLHAYDSSQQTRERHVEQEAREFLDGLIPPLRKACERSGGGADRGWFGTFFEISLPVAPEQLSGRLDFPELPREDWDEFYRQKLSETSWESLRREVYRFCDQATAIADWCVEGGGDRVLVPSVGLCVHPYLFAARGLEAIATDIAEVALDTLAHPGRLPLVYGATAKTRWDISESAMHGGGHPNGFDPMPDLHDGLVCDELRTRIRFDQADWAKLPVDDDSVDVIFATNALPRGNDALREQVLHEWRRAVAPGGSVFCSMHNDLGDLPVGEFLESYGWTRVDALRGERESTGASVYQDYNSTG